MPKSEKLKTPKTTTGMQLHLSKLMIMESCYFRMNILLKLFSGFKKKGPEYTIFLNKSQYFFQFVALYTVAGRAFPMKTHTKVNPCHSGLPLAGDAALCSPLRIDYPHWPCCKKSGWDQRPVPFSRIPVFRAFIPLPAQRTETLVIRCPGFAADFQVD